MAKTKTQKELLASVASSTLASNYDLTRVDAREYAAPLQVLFHSETWKDMFIRRNKLFGAAMHGDANAFKQIDQIDRKVAVMILHVMFKYSQERQKQIDGKVISLKEYLTDFVRTDEQQELYDEFSTALNSAVMIADILESILKDAKSVLAKLDPALVLIEFDSIKSAVKVLEDFTYIHHRDEHEELTSLFCDCVDEIEDYMRMKTALYVGKFKELRESLVNSGKLKEKPIKKHTDKEYLTDLLSNYYYNTSKEALNRQMSFQRANKALSTFSDEELQEAMPVIIDLYRQAETIHMAKETINTTIKSLPQTEATKKILESIL